MMCAHGTIGADIYLKLIMKPTDDHQRQQGVDPNIREDAVVCQLGGRNTTFPGYNV